MAVYSSLSTLLSAAVSAANDVLANEVAEIVKQEIATQEQRLVYGSYSPVLYVRRGSLGSSFQVEPTGINSVRIYDIAPPNYSVFGSGYGGPPGMFAQWINDGNVPNVFNDKSYPWMGARPFYDATIGALQGSGRIKAAAIQGFRRRL